MRLVIQRVLRSSVEVGSEMISKIGNGIMVLVGVEAGDAETDADWLADKLTSMRIFNDANGVMNLSVKEIDGDVLAVSQFTLNASTRKGNRPSYIRAERPEKAESLYEYFCRKVSLNLGKEIMKGRFGADMKVLLINDGPVTIIIDSRLRE